MAAAATCRPVPSVGVGDSWCCKSAETWSSLEVQAFLNSTLPGHDCIARFRHTSGRVLNSLAKDDLRKQARDEEATNVIWAELGRQRDVQREREEISRHGADPYTLFVRTPMDVSVELEVLPSDTVASVKERVAALEGTAAAAQRLVNNGIPMLDSRTLASYNIAHGAMVLLVPRLSSNTHRHAPAHASGISTPRNPSTAIPRPRVPIVCHDIVRPFPMHLEFPTIPEYQSFMITLQRQAGRRDTSQAVQKNSEDAPFLEILPADGGRAPVQTRIIFDAVAEALLIDTVGDILMECTRYRVLLHLREEQKLAHLVTGIRAER